jgi:hypothetical protein
MNNKFSIPKILNIGYNERSDTYTGKLAYVTYTDAKGVLRKEHSWNNWRDSKINPDTFENVPTSGFVLNRNGGGAHESYSSWNTRNEFIRVYDPRGFEFEISLMNLLFILQECTSIKGKGLEGELIYAWDRADLVLLPISSKEYQNSLVHTHLQTKKFSAKELKEGEVYLFKDGSRKMYLGKHDYHQYGHVGYSNIDISVQSTYKGKRFYFYDLEVQRHDYIRDSEVFHIETGTTRIANKDDSQLSSVVFADLYQTLIESAYVEVACNYDVRKKEKINLDRWGTNIVITKEDTSYKIKYLYKNSYLNSTGSFYNTKNIGDLDIKKLSLENIYSLYNLSYSCHFDRLAYERMDKILEEEANKLETYRLCLVNKYNNVCCYLSR